MADEASRFRTLQDGPQTTAGKLLAIQKVLSIQDEALLMLPEIRAELEQEKNKDSAPVATNSGTRQPVAEPPADTNTVAPLVTNTATVEAKENTSYESLLNQITEEQVTLVNPQASSIAANAIEELKKYRDEESIIEAAMNGGGVQVGGNIADLRKSAAFSANDAENLSRSAAGLRREANTRSGQEKEDLLRKAAEEESLSQDKALEAAGLIAAANTTELQANSDFIKEYSEKMKTENPGLYSTVEEQARQANFLGIQASNMRSEAGEQPNKAARLGALGNAEEKEAELLKLQEEIISTIRVQYPEASVPAPVAGIKGNEDPKKQKEELREKQFRQLTDLTNAYTLEFESSKAGLPADVPADLQSALDSANAESSEAKRLLITAQPVSDRDEKLRLMTRAAITANNATEKMKSVARRVPQTTTAEQAVTSGTVAPTPVTAASTKTSSAATGNAVKLEGLEVIPGIAYSAAKPIPVDAKMPEGLVFRVQIGAFKSKIPDNAFRGLTPLNAETTNGGYLRYTAGNFNRIENANAVKNDLRGLGYSDAFVVAYFNGKRITLGEAMAMMQREGRTIDPDAPQTAGITANTNVPRAINNSAVQEPVTISSTLNELNGLFYTIQIGVYNRQVTKQRLMNLLPVFTEALPNGLFRYTAGIYNDIARLNTDKARVVEMGIRDAFVAAYINGKRVGFGEARQRQSTDATIKTEDEKPIIFPSGGATVVSAGNTARPFANGVTGYPPATPENGIKNTEEGVCFKVQIGAYSKEIPAEVATKFAAIRNWPVENKQINNLFIYNIGNFSQPGFAKMLRDEAVSLGITDAFITVYRDGKKLYGAEASALLSR
jgi:hypothetical protein